MLRLVPTTHADITHVVAAEANDDTSLTAVADLPFESLPTRVSSRPKCGWMAGGCVAL